MQESYQEVTKVVFLVKNVKNNTVLKITIKQTERKIELMNENSKRKCVFSGIFGQTRLGHFQTVMAHQGILSA